MTDEQNKNEDQKIERLEDQTDIGPEIRNPKSEVHRQGFFHHKCKNCEKFKKEAEEYKAGWQRAVADYKNLQKEISDRRAEWAQMSEQQILEEFLPVYDNFKLAFRLQTTDYSPEQQKWIDGIKHIKQQFENVLKAHGIEEIKTAGEIFNPELHEAVGEEESEQPEHVILKEVEAGYIMRGRVIKAAKVIVNKISNSPNL